MLPRYRRARLRTFTTHLAEAQAGDLTILHQLHARARDLGLTTGEIRRESSIAAATVAALMEDVESPRVRNLHKLAQYLGGRIVFVPNTASAVQVPVQSSEPRDVVDALDPMPVVSRSFPGALAATIVEITVRQPDGTWAWERPMPGMTELTRETLMHYYEADVVAVHLRITCSLGGDMPYTQRGDFQIAEFFAEDERSAKAQPAKVT